MLVGGGSGWTAVASLRPSPRYIGVAEADGPACGGIAPPCGTGEYGPAAPGAGAAEAVTGWVCGMTTTRVPTLTRSKRSETSSFSMPTQPDETNLPIVDGWLVPWMR